MQEELARQGLVYIFAVGENYGFARSSPRDRLSTGQSDLIIRVPEAENGQSVWIDRFLVARQGLEPWTHALKGRCSTN